MARIPLLPYQKVVRALERIGYSVIRQRGSHIRMTHQARDPVTVPAHNPVARGTLRKILRDAGVSLDEFLR